MRSGQYIQGPEVENLERDLQQSDLDLPFPVPTTGNGTWSLSVQWLVLGDASTFPGGMSQAITWRR